MKTEDQSIAGPGCCHSKRQSVRRYLLKRHCLCVSSIENHTRILSHFAARLGENLQNSVRNSDLQLYSVT